MYYCTTELCDKTILTIKNAGNALIIISTITYLEFFEFFDIAVVLVLNCCKCSSKLSQVKSIFVRATITLPCTYNLSKQRNVVESGALRARPAKCDQMATLVMNGLIKLENEFYFILNLTMLQHEISFF